jgi:hypothetical protein
MVPDINRPSSRAAPYVIDSRRAWKPACHWNLAAANGIVEIDEWNPE